MLALQALVPSDAGAALQELLYLCILPNMSVQGCCLHAAARMLTCGPSAHVCLGYAGLRLGVVAANTLDTGTFRMPD